MSMEERFRYDCSGNWYKGNIHMHTTHSDGQLTVAEAVEFYAGAGYDFICITDHRVPFAGAESVDEWPLLVLDGVELDGRDEEDSFYHVVGIGNVGGVTQEMEFVEALKRLQANGSFLIWAHPHWSGNTVVEGMRHSFHGLEVYNCSSQVAYGKGSGAFHWDAVLEKGADMLGFASDDSHFIGAFPAETGGWIMVNAPECSQDAIMASIKKGNFYSSSGPLFKSITIEQGNRIAAETSPIVHARLIGPRSNNKYKGMLDRGRMTHTHFRIPDDWPFARLEIEDADGKAAWSNPLIKAKA